MSLPPGHPYALFELLGEPPPGWGLDTDGDYWMEDPFNSRVKIYVVRSAEQWRISADARLDLGTSLTSSPYEAMILVEDAIRRRMAEELDRTQKGGPN